ASSQRYVNGTVRLKLFKGSSVVVGRKSPDSLYQHGLATYDRGDTFDHTAAVGFIRLWGLSASTQSRVQGIGEAGYRKEEFISSLISRIPQEWKYLTPEELEILDYIAQGVINKQIATKLNISERVVQNHINSIYSKLKVNAYITDSKANR
ncbi:MAG: LuxR C-terminal-related transcriptional regulator, partial [Chloroflexota bacterium]